MSDNIKKHQDNNIKSDKSTDKKEEKNYFSSLADKYSKASHILYIALAVCFVITLLFNSKLLTYNNFNYLIRDLNTAAEVASENYNSIPYTNNEQRITKKFRGGIITACTTDMAIYTATGKKTLHLNESFVSPQIAASQKYSIIYDLGGNKFSVYSSFARVHTEKMPFPISFATVGDNGWFAIVSKDNAHTSVVYLYDDDFNLKSTYSYASKYVFSVSINTRGNRIGIVTTEADASGEEFYTVIELYEPKKKEVKATALIGGGLPCGSCFTDDDALQILCTDGLYVINENNGTLKNKFEFDSKNIYKSSLTEDGCAVVLSNNQGTVKNTVLAFDKSGNVIYNNDVNNGIFDIEFFEDNIFINQSDSITKINIKNGKISTASVFEKGLDIIVYNSNNVLLCCQTKAKYIKL